MSLPSRTRDTDLAAWDPLVELEQTTRRLTRLLDQAWGSGWSPVGLPAPDEFLPPADLEETDDEYVVELELPGVRKKDVDVEISGRRLTVLGERKERERRGILRRRTRTVGRFRYEVVLPTDVDDDAVTARLVDGVLTLTVPKAAASRRQARRVTVA